MTRVLVTGLVYTVLVLPSAAVPSTEEPTLYVVATSHLDTQWRWTVKQTTEEFIPATLRENFALFEAYPRYTFNFEGAFRYRIMKEYYPREYQLLKRYIAAGRWRVAGSWVDAVDTNVPSPESLVRQALYGNGFFTQEFGVTSRDVFLPDCFGFGAALPSVAAHCGLVGFSTQKLSWGSAVGIPFDIGLWEGVDGSRLVAALNPGPYAVGLTGDQSSDSVWVARARRQEMVSGVPVALRYFGVGDQGGAPSRESVAWLEKSLGGAGPLKVVSAASDQLARDLTSGIRTPLATGLRPELFGRRTEDPAMAALERLPVHRGELLMTDHGAGCYTSQAAMKRWNRKNERLADAAERASVIAHWLGGSRYPREVLREAWVRFLWHQFHDDLTGTSIPEAYAYSWNDEVISLNQFAMVLGDAAGAVCRALDTRVEGVPIVVYNPLGVARTDAVRATVVFDEGSPPAVRVFGPDGAEVPSQVVATRDERGLEIVFVASVPSVGFAVYDIRPATRTCGLETGLAVTDRSLENQRYRVTLDSNGAIGSIVDKREHRELLDAPLRLELLDDEPAEWSAWEVDYEDLMAQPRTVVGGPADVRVIETGPARVGLAVTRRADGSTFTQRIVLGAGDDAVTVDFEIDWRTRGTLLKAAFPLAVRNPEATYDLGLGTIRRGTNRPKLYEVPAQQWADITDAVGGYGVALLNDCRYGWDKPDDHTLRLTLVHTPRVSDGWGWIADQNTQDLGRHRVTCQIVGHRGAWSEARIPRLGDRLNQPLVAIQAPRHDGWLGRDFSFLHLVAAEGGDPGAAIQALKHAEAADEIVIRVRELYGAAVESVGIRFACNVTDAREINGAEEPVEGQVRIDDGMLTLSLTPYQLRSFAVRIRPPPQRLEPCLARAVELPFNLDGISTDEDRTDGDFDGPGNSLAGELLPDTVVCGGVPFCIGPRLAGQANVMSCRGQRLDVPQGPYDQLYLLAAAVGGDRPAQFTVEAADGQQHHAELWIQDHAEAIGQWDSRLVGGERVEDPRAITPAFIKRDPVAWVGTHRHTADGRNDAYSLTHLFRYGIELPPGARTLVFPDDPNVRVVAATAARNPSDDAKPTVPLYDESTATAVLVQAPLRAFVDSIVVTLRSPTPHAIIRYTLDGTEPSEESDLYRGPLVLRSTTTVKARAYAAGLDDAYSAEASFSRLTPRAPATVRSPAPGLWCRLVEGTWERLPDLSAETPSREGTECDIEIPGYCPEEHFALTFSGYIAVPEEGVYQFHLWSDDGSVLWLDGEKLIDNDGLHGSQERRGVRALAAGMHSLRVDFFQRGGDRALELWVEGPGIALQRVPSDWFFHLTGP